MIESKDNLLAEPILGVENVKKYIPQREPMIFVDGLLFLSEKKAISTFIVSEDSIFVENGELSEIAFVENAAQTAALFMGVSESLNNEDGEPRQGYIASVDKIEIFEKGKIGEKLQTELEVVYEVAGMLLIKTETKIDEKLVCSITMKLMLHLDSAQ